VQDKVNPAIMAVAIIIVVAIVAVIGYKVFGPESSGSVEEYRKKYAPNAPPGPLVQHMPPGGATTARPMPPGAPPGFKPSN